MTSNQPWWLTWPVGDVAAAILPWFASNPPEYEGLVLIEIASWLLGSGRPIGYQGDLPFKDPTVGAVAEALQLLEHSRLLMRSPGDRGRIGLTRLGRQALQTGTVREHLGLGDTTPAGGQTG